MVLANCSTEERSFRNTTSTTCWGCCRKMAGCTDTNLSHDGDGCHYFGLGHPVLYQIVHVLIVQQTDEVKWAKAGGAAQGQVAYNHRTEEKVQNESRVMSGYFINIIHRDGRNFCSIINIFYLQPLIEHLPLLSPVEGPVEQKDLGSFRQGDGIVLIGLQYLWDNTAQPAGPLLQRVLLQQSHLEILLQAQHYMVFTLTNPGCLLLRTEWTVSGLCSSRLNIADRTGNAAQTWTLLKSTRLRSESIWLMWAEFWRTAWAAWARWFRLV